LIEIEAVSGAGTWIPGTGMAPQGGWIPTGIAPEGGWIPGTGMAPQGGWIPGA
jgi:hypothetical protein